MYEPGMTKYERLQVDAYRKYHELQSRMVEDDANEAARAHFMQTSSTFSSANAKKKLSKKELRRCNNNCFSHLLNNLST